MPAIEHIGQLKPDPKNRRRHNPRNIGMIRDSLNETGAARSIVIDEDGNILAGNGTVEAAAQAGIERVQVVDADGETIIAVRRSGLTDAQKRRLSIADNRAAEIAEWDVDQLLEDVNAGLDFDGMFSDAELDALLAGVRPSVVADDPGAQVDRAEELRAKWNTERGQLWQIGRHRLLCGDATSAEDVARLMGGERATVVFADPPYGINVVAANGYVGGGEAYNIPFGGRKGLGSVGGAKPFGSKASRGSIGAANVVGVGKYLPVANDDTTDTAVNAYALLAEMFPDAVHVWWGGNYYANALPPSSCWLVWDKENTGNFADCELAWTNQPTAVRIFRHQWNGMLRETERERRIHPTQKPAALAVWCFEKYGTPDDIILDPFVGSAMSMVAAEQLGRAAYGLELEPLYVAVALERLAGMGLEPRLI